VCTAGASSAVPAATPLVVAVNSGRLDCVAELLEAGADQAVCGDKRDTSSPLHLAVANDDVACVRLLLEHARGPVAVGDLVRLSVVSGAGCDVVEALVKSGGGGWDVELAGGCRPLMLAALRGRSDVVDVLLDCGADVDAELTDQQHDPQRRLTALQLAVLAAIDLHCRADFCRR